MVHQRGCGAARKYSHSRIYSRGLAGSSLLEAILCFLEASECLTDVD